MKKSLCVILILLIPLIFSGCNCNHEWKEATCQEPEHCLKCGETGSGIVSHQYADGYCIYCTQEDPNANNLKEIGYLKNYGMNSWIRIIAYNFSENKVYYDADLENPSFYFEIYTSSKYFQTGNIKKDKLLGMSTITAHSLDNMDTVTCNTLSNDVIQVNSGHGGMAPITIIDRVLDSSGKKVIIKTLDETWMSDDEYWYVPADLLDFSTVSLEENKSEYTGRYSISFKP